MYRTITLAVACMLGASSIHAQEVTTSAKVDVAEILEHRIDRDQANVGIAVAVIENGATLFFSHGTWGQTVDTPVDEHTLFEAGSITKLFTNLLLAELVNEGRIDLGAPIVDYLPEGTHLPTYEGRIITAFDLATHSSGLPPIPEGIENKGLNNPYSGYGSDALLEWLGGYELNRTPGAEFSYSNVGTALLAQAIEHVRGEEYPTLLTERILGPLEMTETQLALTGSETPDMAIGHNAGGEAVPHWDFDAFAPVGGLLTTTSDLSKFIAAASGAVESPLSAAFKTMLTRSRPAGGEEAIGLGWFITPTGAGEIVWHNGITGGFRSFAGFERESGKGVVVLSNMVTPAGVEDIGMHLLHPPLPLREQPEAREAIEIDASVLPGYVGDYVLAPGVVISVATEDGRLFAQLIGQEKFELFPESGTKFFYRVVDAQVTFVVDEGKATGLILHQNGQDMPALRVE
jgi:CubicO group peptidase (beta-lactamase class C family)